MNAMARRQQEQHEELMAALAKLGEKTRPQPFAGSAYASSAAPARPQTADATLEQHHRQLEDLMASVRAEHGGSVFAGQYR